MEILPSNEYFTTVGWHVTSGILGLSLIVPLTLPLPLPLPLPLLLLPVLLCLSSLAERERQRRSTIRTLFEQLRKSVPAIESQEGTSDRQILVEAARHVETLQVEGQGLEDELIHLKLENLKLKMATSAAQDHQQLQAEQAELLQLLGETAEIVAMKEELARPVPSSPFKRSPTAGLSAAGTSSGHEASSVGSQGGDLMQLLLVAEQERSVLADS